MDDIILKQKFSPGILEYGFFPYNFEILKNSRISIQYIYFAMFALWNEFEFLKLRTLLEYSVEGKTIKDKMLKKIIKGEKSISSIFNPLLLKLGKKFQKQVEYLEKSKTQVVVGDHEITMYRFKPGEGLYIPFSKEIFGRIGIKDENFCDIYHISRKSLSSARKKLKEFHLIDYDSEGVQGQKMTCFTFIPPIEKMVTMPLKIFYLENLSRSSKVILFWIVKYLKGANIKELNKKSFRELNRKNFMEFSGFRSEKTLRKLRGELIPFFPSHEDLLYKLL